LTKRKWLTEKRTWLTETFIRAKCNGTFIKEVQKLFIDNIHPGDGKADSPYGKVNLGKCKKDLLHGKVEAPH
jgi:hypothetical protein